LFGFLVAFFMAHSLTGGNRNRLQCTPRVQGLHKGLLILLGKTTQVTFPLFDGESCLA
jgi:hypothetical protein